MNRHQSFNFKLCEQCLWTLFFCIYALVTFFVAFVFFTACICGCFSCVGISVYFTWVFVYLRLCIWVSFYFCVLVFMFVYLLLLAGELIFMYSTCAA